MKRYLILILLLFLCSTLWAADNLPYYTQEPRALGPITTPSWTKCFEDGTCKVVSEPVQLARMNPYILGAGASAAAPECSQEIVNISTQANYSTALSRDYFAFSYVAGGTGTYSVTSLSVPARKSNSPTGDVTAYLCADDSGKPAASASCTTMGTYDASTLKAVNDLEGVTWMNFYNASGFSQTAGSTYWVKLFYDQDGTNQIIVSMYGTGTTGAYYSTNDSTWDAIDASALGAHVIAKCAYAAGETPVQGGYYDNTGYGIGNATRYKAGFSFTAPENYCIKKALIPFKKLDGGSLDGTVSVKLYASDGGSPAYPTGAALNTATETLTAGNTTTSLALYTFNFSTCTNLTSGTQYFIIYETDTLNDASNYFFVYNISDGGNAFVSYTTSWNTLDASGNIGGTLFK